MKLNFGHYVLIAYILGAGFILFLVTLSFQIDFQMSEDDYYSKETKMNKLIEGRKRSENIGGLAQLKVGEDQLEIKLSDSLPRPFQEGAIKVYCPSSSHNDYKHQIAIGDTNRLIQIPMVGLKRGVNIIKVEIETKQLFYYEELNFTL
ncbi:MAG: FixH family protein [Saprospiraceae bacterium]|nr:FixH family protein [Saprospiraceae bacterium]